jgi:hypothetical protein
LVFVLHRQQSAQQRASFEGRRTVMSFVARTASDPARFGADVTALVASVDRTTPVMPVRTVASDLDAGQISLLGFGAMLIGIVACVALVTSASGVLALTMSGLAEGHALPMLMMRADAAVVIGAAAGLFAWLRLGSVIESFLTNLTVTPTDPGMLVGIAALLLVMSIMACIIPAVFMTKAGKVPVEVS